MRRKRKIIRFQTLLRRNLVALFFLLGFFAGPTYAQDIRVNYQGLTANLCVGCTLSNFASPGRTFVFTVAPNYSATIFLSNTGGSTDTVVLTAYYTVSQTVVDRTNNSGQWIPLQTSLLPGGALSNSQTIATVAATSYAMSTPIVNATQIAVNFTATTINSDTFNLYVNLTPNGNLGSSSATVQGTVAIGTAFTGNNPVVVAGTTNGLATGTVQALLVDTTGIQRVVTSQSYPSASTSATEAFPNGSSYAPLIVTGYPPFTYANITTATSTSVKATSGFLHEIIVSSGTTPTFSLWDISTNACSTTAIVATQTPATTPYTLTLDLIFTNGLCITTGGTTPNVTVVYR